VAKSTQLVKTVLKAAGNAVKNAVANVVGSSVRESAAKPRSQGSPAKTAGAGRATTNATPPVSSSSGSATRRPKAAARAPRLDRARRQLAQDRVSAEERAMTPTPPSSLDLDRRSSAARSGRAELAGSLADHASMTPSITGGDVDANVENAYFSGDEAPGGDNPTPDQDIVDDIGKALGVEYQDNEELRASDKVADRDRKRWELDPASSEDYRDRGKE